jgi:hypothetical protein
MAGVLIAAGLGLSSCSKEKTPYTGSVSCRSCHEKFYQLWSTSFHGLAMQPYTAELAREKLSPMSKSIAIGKCLSGTTLSLIQAGIIVLLSPFVHVKIHPAAILPLIGVIVITAFALTGVGVLIAPPKVLDAPYPTSSRMIRTILGAPVGACTGLGNRTSSPSRSARSDP